LSLRPLRLCGELLPNFKFKVSVFDVQVLSVSLLASSTKMPRKKVCWLMKDADNFRKNS